MPAVTTAPIRAMSNVVVIFGTGNDITKACNSAQLAATVNEIETTNLGSTGKETTPGQTEYRIECSGAWSKDLDTYVDITNVVKKDASIQFGPTTNRVLYAWVANAYISAYTIDASNPSEVLGWNGTLVLSGAPTRTPS